MINFPFKMRPPPFVPPKEYILEQEFGGRENTKTFTLHKDGGLGKSDAKPKDTMLRANKGDSLRTGRGLSSAFQIDCHSQAACQC